jgi:hypothetical protein
VNRLAALSALALLAAAAPRAGFRLEERLPAGTLLFAEVPSAAAFRDGFKKTPFAKLFDDPEVRAFAGDALDAAIRQLAAAGADFQKATGVSVDRVWEIPSGQVAFALPAAPAQDDPAPGLLLTADCAGKRDTLLKLVAFARENDKKAQSYKIGDVDVLQGALASEVPWHLAVFGDVLAVATTRGALERLAGPAPGATLATSPVFKKARESAGVKDAFIYADVAGLMREIHAQLGEQERKAFAALGLDGFTIATGGLSFEAGRVIERIQIGTKPERRGLAKFLSLKGAARGFEAAPADALHFVSLSIDLAELYDTILDVLTQAEPPAALRLKDEIADLERRAGVTLKGDLFPAFGPAVSAYAALPADGLLPEAVTTFQIRDAARLDACLTSALRNIPAKLGSIDYKGKKIEYFLFDGPSGFDPARLMLSNLYWMRDGDRLHVSGLASLAWGVGTANSLKRHVGRRDQPTLAGAPAVRDWLGGTTGDASFVVFADLERGFAPLYNSLAPFAFFFRGLVHQGGAGVDLLKLPLGETVGKYLSQVIYRVKVDVDALRIEAVSASGSGPMAMAFVGAAAALTLPAIARATENAKTSSCLAELSGLYFAAQAHVEDKKAWPAATGAGFLKALKDGGYLDEEPVCGHAGVPAWRGPAKDVNQADDLEVVFCDEPGNHPDGGINVVRKNGALETLKKDHPDYERALKSTVSIQKK